MKFHLKSSKKSLLIGIAALLIVSAGCSDKKEQPTQRKGRTVDYTEEVTFFDTAGDSITTIQAAVADDQSERSQGLMDVNELPQDHGMLFIFEEQRPLGFWMANTPLSLDIIFVNQDKEIVRIHQNTQPFAEKNFTSGKPAIYVVEINAGFCLSHDIQEGMRIDF
ncbi:MAG: DUF192 domain-containing protein [Balneolaceae bacterium]|nr:DUF192 domain-containing protein [Balneolaceae bacterium]